ncbi:Legume-like lectin family protein [Oesophagostomum dentatum]|uniref:Legume-like lectin family protein n=1 Tax=Oesophagostomum dentatum TaxID=61180 RepID=A0A0B1TCQ5_OESDE|nr:Legume-like lectin family protein [Oesophagostomum dentatum]
MWRILLLFGAVTAQAPSASPSAAEVLAQSIDGTSVHEFRGYYKREHSLTRPYQGAGMEIPYWNIQGSAMVSSQQVRLTADEQSRQGAIWNMQPVWSRDWEFQVSFKVTGSTGDLFGDGLAIWYVSEPNQMGPVFGGKDYFRGLGVFLDTYSNHNGPHSHAHPYISAMVSDGTLHYDHDMDGTHTQLGGEHTGCEAKFRNKDHETQILLRYVGDTLSIFTDITGKYEWKLCLSVNNVQLPTGYYFGISAATGDLSDNHDVIAVKMFEQEFAHVDRVGETDRKDVVPRAEFKAAPRDHIDNPRPSKLGWFGTIVLVIVGIVVLVGVLGFGVIFFQKRSERQRKRFY